MSLGKITYRICIIVYRAFCTGYTKNDSLYDLKEEYQLLLKQEGEKRANKWLMREVARSIPYSIKHVFYWGGTMIFNYAKIAVRNLLKHKAYSLLMIVGLSIGFGLFFLFSSLSYVDATADTFHRKSDRMFSTIQVIKSGDNSERHTGLMPEPFGRAVKAELPQIEEVCRFYYRGQVTIKRDNHLFYENEVLAVDENFLEVFDFKLVEGQKETVFSDPYSIVLTKEKAVKYFGDEDPLGKSLLLNNEIYTVSGVIEDEPINSTISYEFIIPFESGRNKLSWMDDWRSNNVATYLLLKDNESIASVEAQMPSVIEKHFSDDNDRPERIYFMPIEDMYLNTIEVETLQGKHFAIVALIFFFSGITILVIVSINYVSLSTSRFMTRAKEIGLRKVMGANRRGLIKQFLTESVIVSFSSVPLGVLIYFMLSQYLSREWQQISDYSMWQDPSVIVFILSIIVLVGIGAGIYPAVFLSSFETVKVLKGTFHSVKKGSFLKKSLLSFQFILAIVLIVFSIALNRQFNYVLTTDMGYNKDNVLTFAIHEDQQDKSEYFKEMLKEHSSITKVSSSYNLPCHWDDQIEVIPEGKSSEDSRWTNQYLVGYSFLELYQMTLLEGRSFDRDYNDKNSVIINETAVERFGWKNPLGKIIDIEGSEYTVIGVVKDFSFKDIHFPIIPSAILLDEENNNFISARVNSEENISAAKTYAENIWEKVYPDVPFNCTTHADYFKDIYKGLNTISELAGGVGIVGILLAIMGVLGLTAYHVERKTKEVGIRKVLGATETSLIKMLSKEFMMLVLIANVIALPMAYFITESFFQWGFVFRTSVGLDIIFSVLVSSILATLLIVVSQTLKAARVNPVDSLKCE